MMNRRRFLTTGMIGAGLACTPGLVVEGKPQEPAFAMNVLDEKWARADLERLGMPRSWWHVHQGLHPFSPERILVIDERPQVWAAAELKNRLIQRGVGNQEHFSEEKLDYALWIMHTLSNYYGRPQYFEDWATRLAGRENLGPALGYCRHWGLVHQFQQRGDHQPVATQNGLVDWWAFLIPGGASFQSLDGLPTHVLFGCVDANGSPSREFACLPLVWKLAQSVNGPVLLSQMDRLTAARFLNQRLVEVLP